MFKFVFCFLGIFLWTYNPTQGRIQDLKLGVAQIDWKFLKVKTVGGVCVCVFWGGGGGGDMV